MIHAVFGAVAVVVLILTFAAGHWVAWRERDKRDSQASEDQIRRERGELPYGYSETKKKGDRG